jgi:DNA gyrase/topoisomerase IV subunit A
MQEFRFRPKSEFMNEASWQELYMKFFEDESRFLHNLIDKYFIWLTQDENISTVQRLASRIRALDKGRDGANSRLKLHLSHLASLENNTSELDHNAFRIEHQELEDEISSYVKEFRKVKTEVFSITESVMDSEKLQHLLSKE